MQRNGEGLTLESREAAAVEARSENGWVRRFTHPLLEVEVAYTLAGAAALKTVTVAARAPLTLCYARTEVAAANAPLSRGGRGAAAVRGNGRLCGQHLSRRRKPGGREHPVPAAGPFVSLEAGERFALAPVVFGLNTEGDMTESFLRFLRPRRPHPDDTLRIYCDWGAHDELSDDAPPELDEAMAGRLLADVRAARERTASPSTIT